MDLLSRLAKNKKKAKRLGSRRSRGNARSLQLESLERRELLTAVSVSVSDGDAGEPSNPGQFLVTRDSGVGSYGLTVQFKFTGTADYDSDYNSYPGAYWDSNHNAYVGSVTIDTFSDSAPVDITPWDDSLVEGDESVILTLLEETGCGCCCGGGSYTVGSPSSATITITDDETDPLPAVSISLVQNAHEGVSTGYFRLERTGSTANSLTVDYWFDDPNSTADNGVDFAYLPGTGSADDYGSATFLAGQSYVDIVVDPTGVYDDTIVEGDETVLISLQSSGGCCGGSSYTLGTPSNASLTIADNDSPLPKISIDDQSVTEGDGVTMIFTVTLSATSTDQVTVDYTTLDGPEGQANSVQDYVAQTGTLTFAPGTITPQTITITINNDKEVEGTEVFYVKLSNVTYATIADDTGNGTILDNDVADELIDDPIYCSCGCPTCGPGSDQKANPQTGSSETKVSTNVAHGGGITFAKKADFSARPAIGMDVEFQPTTLTRTTVETQLTMGGVASEPIFYDAALLDQTQSYRFAANADASSLPTGRHPWQMTVTEHFQDEMGNPSTRVRTFEGQHDVNNRTDA
ncbi:MAG TPA: Calx-beta domain-containing protein, partial [Pirellulaceae bacterium]|nr:Calx-beta domain-containing protein [Pirellulaceae bacterium]